MSQLRVAFIVGVAGLLIGSSCFAQAKKELTPQQQRMGECAHQGKGKKGDDYKQFMKECLKSKKDAAPTTAAKPTTTPKPTATAASAATATAKQAPDQKEKMKSCNAQAKEKSLKGDARKTFMSDCLKG